MDEIDQKDDGYIELVLRVLARMCDGQHRGLQVRCQVFLSNIYYLCFTLYQIKVLHKYILNIK